MSVFISNEEYRKVLREDITVSNKGVVSLPSNLYNDIMLITASCGFGKTYYTFNSLLDDINAKIKFNALFEIPKEIEKEEVLYLTSRKVIKLQQAKSNDNVIIARISMYTNECNNWESEEYKGKIRITTAHQWGEWVKEGLITEYPKVIVIDEIQSLFSENIFAESLLYTIKYLKAHWNDTIKIGLTATPQFLLNYITARDSKITFKIIDKQLGSKYHVKRIRVLLNGQLSTIKGEYEARANKDYKILEYCMSATKCAEYHFTTKNSAFMISEYNDKEYKDTGITLSQYMNNQEIDGVKVKDYIIDNCRFPKGIDILYINSAYREGMNIQDDKVKVVLCEAVDMITIEQILGRIRGDIDELAIVCNFNNKSMLEKQIESVTSFLNSNPTNADMIDRYIAQEKNKYMPKVVYRINGDEFRINQYGIAYLQYMNESYIQLSNRNESNYVSRIADRNILMCDEYIKQLCRYAVDGRITIEVLQKATIEMNHSNAVAQFQKIESEWINKPLTTQDKKELCALLALIRSNGKCANWNTLKQMLIDNGYTIEDKRNSKYRYSVISK